MNKEIRNHLLSESMSEMDNIALAWSDLSVCARLNSNMILNNISGSLSVGSFNALMGSSGSGKSTLLKCLNGSQKYCLSQTSLIFWRKDIDSGSTFIYQDQEHRIMSGLTVETALTYSSKIKNSSETGVNHKEIVCQLMDEFMLNDVKDNRIDNCSGGQIKRICIALELTSITKPHLLLIDEPTTGLDSYAAQQVLDYFFLYKYLTRMGLIKNKFLSCLR